MKGNDSDEPYFDLNKTSGCADYMKHWLDVYNCHALTEAEFHQKLTKIFSKTSPYQIRVLYGNDLATVFRQRLGKRRRQSLRVHLEKIDKESYGEIKWEYT